MRFLYYYRGKYGNRMIFRSSEIVGVPQPYAPNRTIVLTTVYGSKYTVMTTAPEEHCEDIEKMAEPGKHVHHWTPVFQEQA